MWVQFLKFTSYKGIFHFDTYKNLESSDTIQTKYLMQTMFNGTIVTIYLHFIPNDLKPLLIFVTNSNELSR